MRENYKEIPSLTMTKFFQEYSWLGIQSVTAWYSLFMVDDVGNEVVVGFVLNQILKFVLQLKTFLLKVLVVHQIPVGGVAVTTGGI